MTMQENSWGIWNDENDVLTTVKESELEQFEYVRAFIDIQSWLSEYYSGFFVSGPYWYEFDSGLLFTRKDGRITLDDLAKVNEVLGNLNPFEFDVFAQWPFFVGSGFADTDRVTAQANKLKECYPELQWFENDLLNSLFQ